MANEKIELKGEHYYKTRRGERAYAACKLVSSQGCCYLGSVRGRTEMWSSDGSVLENLAPESDDDLVEEVTL